MNRRVTLPKRPKTRVRTGCESCKARKLKCDERKPICRRCEVGNWHCVYRPPKVWLFESSKKTLPRLEARQNVRTESRNGQFQAARLNSRGNGQSTSRQLIRQKRLEQVPPFEPSYFVSMIGKAATDPAAMRSLSYYINTYAPSHGVIVTVKDGTNGLLTRLLPWALQDSLILDVIIAESYAYAAEGKLDSKYGLEAALYRRTAVRKLMRRLQDGCSHATIQAVICLVFIDMRFGFLDHCRTHLMGLRAMVLHCGGLNALGCDGMQRDIILLFDEIFGLFREGDEPECCEPRLPLLSRFGSFDPAIGAKKHGLGFVPQTFLQQGLFPWLRKPLELWNDQPKQHFGTYSSPT